MEKVKAAEAKERWSAAGTLRRLSEVPAPARLSRSAISRGFIFLRDLRAKFFWQARARHDRSRGYAGPYAGRAPARKLSGVGRSALELRGMAVPLAKSGISA